MCSRYKAYRFLFQPKFGYGVGGHLPCSPGREAYTCCLNAIRRAGAFELLLEKTAEENLHLAGSAQDVSVAVPFGKLEVILSRLLSVCFHLLSVLSSTRLFYFPPGGLFYFFYLLCIYCSHAGASIRSSQVLPGNAAAYFAAALGVRIPFRSALSTAGIETPIRSAISRKVRR